MVSWHTEAMVSFDPDLVGIWIVPGERRTYEVMADGSYHIADPEEPVRFDDGGAVMIWGPRRHRRLEGSGATPLGRWRAEATGEDWVFAADGGYTVTAGGQADIGIWALRRGGTALWTRELNAQLTANGAEVTFHPIAGGPVRFGYTVKDGVWTLLDPRDWSELARYVAPGAVRKTG